MPPAVEAQSLNHWITRGVPATMYFFVYFFWLRWVFVAVHRLSLVAASGGLLILAVRGLLIAVASLVAEHRL